MITGTSVAGPFPHSGVLCGPSMFSSSCHCPCPCGPCSRCFIHTLTSQTPHALWHCVFPCLPGIVLPSPTPESSYAPSRTLQRESHWVQGPAPAWAGEDPVVGTPPAPHLPSPQTSIQLIVKRLCELDTVKHLRIPEKFWIGFLLIRFSEIL